MVCCTCVLVYVYICDEFKKKKEKKKAHQTLRDTPTYIFVPEPYCISLQHSLCNNYHCTNLHDGFRESWGRYFQRKSQVQGPQFLFKTIIGQCSHYMQTYTMWSFFVSSFFKIFQSIEELWRQSIFFF